MKLKTLVLSGIMGLEIILTACSPVSNPCTVLEKGTHNWPVYVAGAKTEWGLNYSDYDHLPVHNNDYGKCVTYGGIRYDLWRVSNNQIQVSGPK